ncbi:hypothetical protein PSTG_08040 [Puccinia striiformis f. sp. tritici PST-78]|uniref:Uncharacterized protein n=1 Tax=Puccinia striiformis f. sp. tritici PST-78 TaxID=1165861 RepID=A0A0L0VHB6_9BASI|nr:hypothetical protein PSTG_08040 [Puccinia striiformis f. sp. tritici PST-78]
MMILPNGKHHNTPTREDPFENLGNQTPRENPQGPFQEPPRAPPRGPPRGTPTRYGLYNIGSPEDIPERKPGIIKDSRLFYSGEHFMKFLERFERSALVYQTLGFDKSLQIGWFLRNKELRVQLEAMDGYKEYNWKKLRQSMIDSWGKLDNTILYTNQDLAELKTVTYSKKKKPYSEKH